MEIIQPQNNVPVPEDIKAAYESAQNQVNLWNVEVTTLQRAKMAAESEIEALIKQKKQACDEVDLVNESLSQQEALRDILVAQIKDLQDQASSLTQQKTELLTQVSQANEELESVKEATKTLSEKSIEEMQALEAKEQELDAREAKVAIIEKAFNDAIATING